MLAPALEFPPDLEKVRRKARRLAWWTVAYLVSVGIVLYLVLGSSQAMKAAWLEDVLSIIPPAVFLAGDHFARKKPNPSYPYGYHRAVSIAFLAASGALIGLALWLIYDSATKLVTAEHPTIGLVEVFGHQIWLGWLMIAALLYSGIPPIFIGRIQIRHARQMHDKTLYAGGSMRKADWLTSSAAIVGVIGIGFGFWWTDSAAALIISLDVLRDGWVHLRTATGDVMDRRPTTVEGKPEKLPDRLRAAMLSLDWVSDAQVRLREEGHLFFGEVFVVPSRMDLLPARIQAATRELKSQDWRIGDLVITVLPDLDPAPEPAERQE